MSKLDEMIKDAQWTVNWHTEKLEEAKLKLKAYLSMKEKGNE